MFPQIRIFPIFCYVKLSIAFTKTDTTSVIFDIFQKFKLDDEAINLLF